MQNRFRSADEAAYVMLGGGWYCPRCGCSNPCGDSCHDCGWNRCGCQGGVVREAAQAACGCANEYDEGNGYARCGCQGGVVREAAQAACGCTAAAASRERDAGCDACPASFVTGHSVQGCPDNTRIRYDSDCGCNEQTTERRPCGCTTDCGCTAQTTAQRACGCNEQTTERRPCGCATDCGCNEQTTERRLCGCSTDCGCTAQTTAQRACGCNEQTAAARGCNGLVGIVQGVRQKLERVFESESALRTGTLFPELHKPMNGRCPGSCNCSTADQQAAFATWDLRLYLDTHPDDEEAWALFHRLQQETADPNYATTFLKDGGCGCAWGWTDDPWPWECQKCGK